MWLGGKRGLSMAVSIQYITKGKAIQQSMFILSDAKINNNQLELINILYIISHPLLREIFCGGMTNATWQILNFVLKMSLQNFLTGCAHFYNIFEVKK